MKPKVLALALLVVVSAQIGSGCAEEAPPPKMPSKVYVPWLIPKKRARPVITATDPEGSDEARSEETDAGSDVGAILPAANDGEAGTDTHP